jgi:hypothetical protein
MPQRDRADQTRPALGERGRSVVIQSRTCSRDSLARLMIVPTLVMESVALHVAALVVGATIDFSTTAGGGHAEGRQGRARLSSSLVEDRPWSAGSRAPLASGVGGLDYSWHA